MQEVILANAQYWLQSLQAAPGDAPIPEIDLRGAARAIEAAIRIPAAWEITLALARSLHPHMEQRGFWTEWDACLQILAGRARQQADRQAEADFFLKRAAIQRQRGDFE